MDRQLQQRVVGAAVLTACGVIVIPIFLNDGALERDVIGDSQVPPPPTHGFSSTVIPLSEADIEHIEARATIPLGGAEEIAFPAAGAQAEVQAEAVVGLAPATDGGPGEVVEPRTGIVAWTVQLGSFNNDDNARTLIEELRKEGYPAYLERRFEDEVTVFKVRVGPEIRREDAENLRTRLEQDFAMKGMILRYQ